MKKEESKKDRRGFVLNKITIVTVGGVAILLVLVWFFSYYFDGGGRVWLGQDAITEVIVNPPATDHPSSGYQAKNLVDGNSKTIASPSTPECGKVDFTIKLAEKFDIGKVEIIWREQGTSNAHINAWSLSAEVEEGKWEVLADEKKSPMAEVSTVNVNGINATALRLVGVSNTGECNGVYEVRILGRRAAE